MDRLRIAKKVSENIMGVATWVEEDSYKAQRAMRYSCALSALEALEGAFLEIEGETLRLELSNISLRLKISELESVIQGLERKDAAGK